MATKKKAAKAKTPSRKATAKSASKKATPVKKTVTKAAPKKAVKKPVIKKTTAPKKETITTMKPIWEEQETASAPVSLPVEQKESKSTGLMILIALIAVIAVVYFFFKPQIDSLISPQPEKISEPSVISTQQDTPPETPVTAEKDEPVPAVVEKAEPSGTPVAVDGDYYLVQPKDNLVQISENLYGRYDRWREIYEANRDKITDPKVIHIGQKLLIPGMKK